MFRFDPDNEHEIVRQLDELKQVLNLPSRGHVVELAIRQLWVSTNRLKTLLSVGKMMAE